MFGDFGHGLVLLLFGLFLVWTYKETTNTIAESYTDSIYKMRYLLVLLGVFSTYSGLIYNEFMSLKIPFFRSCYEALGREPETCVYPFGFDWIWGEAVNETGFMNSYRTKLSIIIGVSHMILGILLKGLNNIFTRNWVSFF